MKKKMMSFVTLIGLILCFLIPSQGIAATEDSADKQITVGVSAQSKPYNYYNEANELAGFEIDLFSAIEEELDGYTFNFEITEFASLFAGVDSGKFDLIANNIGESDERREKYVYSKYPYIITHNVLITRPDEGDHVTLEDMAGQSMGLVAGSLQAVFMEKYNEENPDLAIQLDYVDTDGANIIREVASGRYDMTIYSTTYLEDVKNTFDLNLVGHLIEREEEIQPPGAYFLYQKNEESFALRNKIDTVLAQLREEGTLAEISEKHFGQDDSQLTDRILEKNEAINQELLRTLGQTDDVTQVIVGTSGQTKPLNYFDETNTLVGVEIEILEEINRRNANLKITYEITDFPSLFAGLDSGRFDLVSNNLGENAERREKFLFSLYPYVITHNVIITDTDQAANLTIEDLAGKSFGVVPASPQSMFLETWNEENPDRAVDIQYVDSDPSTIIRDVHSGRFDATIYNTTYLHDVQETFDIELLAHAIANEEVIRPPGSYFIYSTDNETIRNQIDATLAEMRADGTLAAISRKYLASDDTVLTEEIIAKNDAIEAERLLAIQAAEADSQEKSSDGKLFAPEMILQMLPIILEKLPITILMTVVAGAIGISLGLLIAMVKINEVPVLTQLFTVFVSFLRGTPKLVQLFLAFYGLPMIVQWLNQQVNWQVDVNGIPALVYVFIAFGLNEAAYNSETFRAAILSVDPKEIEAAKSIGLTNQQTMRRITLPSALIVAIPNLGNSLISLLKGTSLAFTVTVIDIMGQARIVAGANLRFFEAYIAVALIYWLFCILIEQGVAYLERKLNIADRPLEQANL